ncbi:MAG: restriction endonuclease [Proteobacteria bacterium]|nr:restriction endonuclease [Pseudomonadota bacterium]MCG2758732.1 restriction endonuclease [Desulfobacteraceae bacterium]
MPGVQDAENLYLENYEHIGFRNLNILKENGIRIKENELGIKFEDLTKSIFTKLGFNVDKKLRQLLNTKKEKIDIVINLSNKELILIECKTIKESGYNKFSSVSRQLKAIEK